MGSFGVNMRLAVVLMLISSLEISLAFVQTRAVISIESPMTKTGLRCSALNDLKSDIIRACNNPTTTASQIGSIVQDFEDKAEQMGEGQSSSVTGLMAGKWELVYSPEDVTRSSPFFWAFSEAFPDTADQVFAITDAIPAPIKEVGPAYQTIELSENGTTGKLVSRIKVATLNGFATSIMTTRAEITGIVGVDGLKLQIESTKPEDSTAIKMLGPFGNFLNDNLPPFPSGQALEQVQPGSSMVIMRTTFCDDGLRVSRNEKKYDDIYVWKRIEFADTESL